MAQAVTPAPGKWQPTIDGHNPRLDGVRGMAILLVLFQHLLLRWDGGGFTHVYLTVARLGWVGVDLFFVLSGFLITGILLRNRQTSESTAGYFLKFEARRFFRIFPLYYSVLLILLVIVPRIEAFAQFDHFWNPEGVREPIWYWLYLSNFHAAATEQFHHQFLAVTWSLAIEEQYYILWPTVVYVLSRGALARVCVGLIVFATLTRIVFGLTGVGFMTIYTLPACRMDGLAVGSLVAIMIRSPAGLAALRALARPVLWSSALMLVLVTAVPYMQGFRGQYYELPAFLMVGLPAINFLFASALVLAVLSPPERAVSRLFTSRFLIHLGKYSYAMYLFHLIAREIVTQISLRIWQDLPPQTPGGFFVAQALFFLVSFAVTMAMAYTSWYLLESRFLALKRYVQYREK